MSAPTDARLLKLARRIDSFDEGRPGLAWIGGFFTTLVMMGGLLDMLRWPIALGVPLGLSAGLAVGFVVHLALKALTTRWKRHLTALIESARIPRAELITDRRT